MQKVKQTRPDRISLSFSDRSRFLLVPVGAFARIHPVSSLEASPQRPFHFQSACRAHLKGKLLRVTQHEGDRVLDLCFSQGRLHLRMTGRFGGLWLYDKDRLVAQLGHAPPEPPSILAGSPPSVNRSPRFDGDPLLAFSAAHYFGEVERAFELEQAERIQDKARRRAKKKNQRLIDRLTGDLRRSRSRDVLRNRADSMACELYELKGCRGLISFPDLTDPDARLSVDLLGIKPAVFVNRLYLRVKKLERAEKKILERLTLAQTTRDQLAQPHLPSASAARPIQQITRSLRAKSWSTWHDPHGRTAYVGRHSAGNRALCFQVARGDDLWFHVRDRPGPHLLFRMERGQNASLEQILSCARLLLSLARVPQALFTDVQYTHARFLRAVKGQSGGLVTLTQEKVVRVQWSLGGIEGWSRHDSSLLRPDPHSKHTVKTGY